MSTGDDLDLGAWPGLASFKFQTRHPLPKKIPVPPWLKEGPGPVRATLRDTTLRGKELGPRAWSWPGLAS